MYSSKFFGKSTISDNDRANAEVYISQLVQEKEAAASKSQTNTTDDRNNCQV